MFRNNNSSGLEYVRTNNNSILAGEFLNFGLGNLPKSTSIGWNLNTLSYTNIAFDFSNEGTNNRGIFMNPSGSRLYLLDGQTVFQYSLVTADDISSASYDSKSYTSSELSNGSGVFIKPDGTKMYMTGYGNDTVFQYTLSTPWDVSTASYDTGVNLDISTEDEVPYTLVFSTDGTKMYIPGGVNDTVFQYVLTTPWDLSTASYDNKFVDIGSESTSPWGIFFKPDGMKMYILDFTGHLFQYTLSTPWDVSTASYDTITKDITGQATQCNGLWMNQYGNTAYITTTGGLNSIYQYSLTS